MSLYLVLLGLILSLPVSFYAFLVPLTQARMARESAGLIAGLPVWSAIASARLPIPQSSETLALLLIVMAILAFGAYGAAIILSWGAEPTTRGRTAALIVAAVLWFIAYWALPTINTDIFNYILRGRLAAVHQSNPYYTAADEFPDDPLYPYAGKAYTQFRGGKLPAWMYLNIALASVTGDNPIVNLMVYRGGLLLMSGANLLMIGLILNKLYPQHLLTGILIYAWNPIVIISGGSKVDTVMVFYLLLGVVLLLSRRRVLAVIALVLSSLTKLITLPLAAVTMLDHVRRRDWRRFALESLVFGIAALLIYAPFVRGFELFSRLIGLGKYANANAGTAAEAAISLVPIDLFLKIGFVTIVLFVGLRQDGSLPGMLRGWAIALLYFSIFLAPISLSHYMITLITIVSLVPIWYLVALTIVMSSASFLINSWETSFSAAFPSPDLFSMPVYFIYVGTIVLAGVTIGAVQTWRKRIGQV